MSERLQVEIRSVVKLAVADRAAMERLYCTYYEGAPAGTFQRDLASKDLVVLLRDETGVRGFSTVKFLEVEGLRILFSGDTVVDVACRNQTGLAGGFGHVMAWMNRQPETRSPYWFLICKGARTYRFLPTFFKRFVPGEQTDKDLAAKLHSVARACYPQAYNPVTGVLHFDGAKDRLRSDVLRQDAESIRFRTLNPNWAVGDELCCLVPLEMSNLNRLGERVIAAVDPIWDL